MTFYFRKMISAKTRYETYDQKLLFIIIAFQQWNYYLKNNRYFIEILTNHYNLRYFMITIILNRRQICWFLIFAKYDFEIKYRVRKINFVDESSRRSNYENEIDDEFCLLTLQNKLKDIFVTAIELYSVVTRDIARAHESRSKNAIISSRMKEIKNDFSKLLLEESEFDQQDNVVTQQLRRANVDAICEKKASFEKSFKMLLTKIEKFQKKNSMIIRMREQLKSLIERKICANREWSVNKKNLLRYFHVIYVFEKASLRFALLRFYHDDFLTKLSRIEDRIWSSFVHNNYSNHVVNYCWFDRCFNCKLLNISTHCLFWSSMSHSLVIHQYLKSRAIHNEVLFLFSS